jgi:hypothetical protein
MTFKTGSHISTTNNDFTGSIVAHGEIGKSEVAFGLGIVRNGKHEHRLLARYTLRRLDAPTVPRRQSPMPVRRSASAA